MSTQIRDVKLTVRDLLRANWDNTSMVESLADSDIHTGWYDAGKGFPQISVTSDEEGVVDGGNSGVTGLKGDGSGVTQHRNGTVLVTCWAGSEEDYANRGEEQQQVQAMGDEVERIVFANVASVSGLNSLAVTTREKLVNTDENPAEHRIVFEVSYNWQKR